MKLRHCVIALFGALLFFLAPALAHADENVWHPIDAGVYQITVASDGSALDVQGGSTDQEANVGFYGPNGTAAQKWSVAYEADGTARIDCLCSGQALTAPNAAPSANIVQRNYGATPNQRWWIEVQDDGTYALVSSSNTALALTSTSANAALGNYDANASQRLNFTLVAPLADGVYTLAYGNGDMVLDVAGASMESGANVWLYSSNQTQAQKWYASRQDDGSYVFESLMSGLALTAENAGSGANLCQQPASVRSRFYLEPADGGSFALRLKGTDCVIDVTNGDFSAGANMQIWQSNSTAAQRIHPIACDPLAGGYYTIAPASNTSTRWDVAGASMTAGANLQLWNANGGFGQSYAITPVGSGVYEIRLCVGDRVIAPRDGSAAAGANIEIAVPDNTNSQRWRFVYEGAGLFSLVSVSSGLRAEVIGNPAEGANLVIALPRTDASQLFRFDPSSYVEPPYYYGFQNPPGYYQVSDQSVWFPHIGQGIFGYCTPSRLSKSATKSDCIETMVGRAYEYLGTPYRWDYSCAPGVGVDCAGLVLQALYSTGMDLSPMNPWDHYYTPGHDHYAGWMAGSSGFKHVSFAERQRGDLIFYSGHVAIYLGNNTIIEANTPGVVISNVYAPGTIIGVGRPYI